METSFLKVGSKLDIRLENQPEIEGEENQPRTFKSVIYNILENGNLEISMPMSGGKLILLALDVRYELVIYTREGMYHCIGQVRERYKKDNLYMVSIELKTAPSKLQRREFYRLKCLLDIRYLPVSQEDVQTFTVEELFRIQKRREEEKEETWREAVAMDISGGGIRFVSREELKAKEQILIRFTLQNALIRQEFELLGNVLLAKVLEDSSTRFEVRVKFELDDERVREQIIRYIFEEERKNRKR